MTECTADMAQQGMDADRSEDLPHVQVKLTSSSTRYVGAMRGILHMLPHSQSASNVARVWSVLLHAAGGLLDPGAQTCTSSCLARVGPGFEPRDCSGLLFCSGSLLLRPRSPSRSAWITMP